jgi:hypothetical protein
MGLNPKASIDEAKWRHPDITENGEVAWDAFIPPARRDFLRLQQDPARWAQFMNGVAERQRREHQDVQSWVGGQHYQGDPLEAFQAYQQDLQTAREALGHDKELTSYDVQNMSLEEYDRAFDERGRPREGYSFRRTDRDIVADDQAVDRFTRGENEMRARDSR